MKKLTSSLVVLFLFLSAILLGGCEALKKPKDPDDLHTIVSAELKKDFPLEIDLAAFNQTAQKGVWRDGTERVLFEGILRWNLKEMCEQAGFQLRNLKQLELEEVTIKAHTPSDYNVGFFRKLSILSGTPLKPFAQSDNSNAQDQITFTLSDKDLLKLLKNEELAIKLVTTQKGKAPMVDKLLLVILFKGNIKVEK
ncbi:hypothetical protein HQ36_05795 [Porphyromonas gingivicanis]|uniref:Lipoprotein n=2 Tax=Porphyromonas gingivicanis TaxID=266762 RepID=A0A0A2G3D3_9PORP|nr:hypothetical protein [Porphyromonas gingivicanis]KGN97771.1 hypothetical protein HQ36_05795 [Porphyromonas gingivicanis]